MKIDMIRNIGRICVIMTFAAASLMEASAQEYVNTPVTISTEKIRSGNQLCYSHVVLERQTLFSISKAYDVSVEDIYRFNPTLKENGLKKNSIILIPILEKNGEATSEARKTVAAPQPEPQAAAASDVRKKDNADVKPKKSKKKQTIHVRKWFEDIYTIAEKYGTTPEAIRQANNLSSDRLANRQKLIIPDKDFIVTAVAEQAEEVVGMPAEDSVTVTVEIPEDTFADWTYTPKDKVNATLLLPLKTANGNISRNNMDFYSGAMLAVYDLAEKGISTDFRVIDITDKSHPVTSEDINGADVVIGPVSSGDIARLLESFDKTSTVISPLDPKAEELAATHSNLVQVPTPHRAQYEDLTEWIKEDLTAEDTVLVISEKAFKQSDAAKAMMEVMDSSGIAHNSFSYNILEGRDVIEPLKALMTMTGTNRVMIASESEAFVNDVVRNLNLMIYEQYKVVLYAPSKIRSFETIEVEHFHKTNMHVSLTYYIDYEDPRVREFLLKYRALYNTEPSQFAFQGYDITSYFINLCSRYGEKWMEKIGDAPQAMLQSTFRCRKANEGGYVNNGVRRIVYEDGWKVSEIK